MLHFLLPPLEGMLFQARLQDSALIQEEGDGNTYMAMQVCIEQHQSAGKAMHSICGMTVNIDQPPASSLAIYFSLSKYMLCK